MIAIYNILKSITDKIKKTKTNNGMSSIIKLNIIQYAQKMCWYYLTSSRKMNNIQLIKYSTVPTCYILVLMYPSSRKGRCQCSW